MIGRVGTIFGEEGVNIVSAAVGAEPDGEAAVMALTTDAPVNPSTIERILQLDGFFVGRPYRCDSAAVGSWRCLWPTVMRPLMAKPHSLSA